MELVVLEAAVLERVDGVVGLLEVAVVELVGVDDDDAAALEVAEVGLERRRVHRDQYVGLIARSVDVVVGDAHLEGGDAGQRALGGADLGGEVGQRREVVADQGRGVGELRSGELHPVARVAGEPDHDVGKDTLVDGLLAQILSGHWRGHGTLLLEFRSIGWT